MEQTFCQQDKVAKLVKIFSWRKFPAILYIVHVCIFLFPDSYSEPGDNVHLWEEGWKELYYNNKFGVPSYDDEFTCSLAEQYTRGLCWVLGYYYQVGTRHRTSKLSLQLTRNI